MTNYINSITLEDGSTYNIGPCYITGSDNVVVAGSPTFGPNAANNLIMCTPGTAVSCSNSSGTLFIQTGTRKLIIGNGHLSAGISTSDVGLSVGNAIYIDDTHLDVGPVHLYKFSTVLAVGSSYSFAVNGPGILLAVGTETYDVTDEYGNRTTGSDTYIGYAEVDIDLGDIYVNGGGDGIGFYSGEYGTKNIYMSAPYATSGSTHVIVFSSGFAV